MKPTNEKKTPCEASSAPNCSAVLVSVDISTYKRNCIATLPVLVFATIIAFEIDDRFIAYAAGAIFGLYVGMLHYLIHGIVSRMNPNPKANRCEAYGSACCSTPKK